MFVSDRQQVQIMVTKRRDRPISEVFNESQYFKVFGAPVYQVTNEPESIAVRFKLDYSQELQ